MTRRGIAAVAAGIGINFGAIPVDLALFATHVFAPPEGDTEEGQYAIALAYRVAFAALGGWVAARIALTAPMTHACVLGGLGVLFASLGAAAQWSLGHHWYSLALVALSPLATLAGAHVYARSQS